MLDALSGVRVLDLSRFLAGPYGSLMLGDLGAEVIKIEVPGSDEARIVPGPKHKGDTYHFVAYNRNKKSLCLDLATEGGRQAFYELVKISDVVWDNFRPGVVEKLGADYDTLKKINPRIITCSITGYGPSGPYRDLPSYDPVVWAQSGLMSLTGEPGRTPVKPGPALGDVIAGMHGTLGVAAALHAREKTGVGRKVEVAMLDVAFSLLGHYIPYYLLGGGVPQPLGSGHVGVVPLGAFPAKRGYVVVGPCWPRITRVLGAEWLADDPRFATREGRVEHRDELNAILADLFIKEDADDWVEVLRVEGIGAASVATVDKAVADPQIVHNGMVIGLRDSEGGEVRVAGTPIKMPGREKAEDLFPPKLGEHTRSILKGLLGYSDEKIEQLNAEREAHSKELEAHLHKVFTKLEQQAQSPQPKE